jgi:DNA-directed RNA polymerase subunit RPC12/RpoP
VRFGAGGGLSSNVGGAERRLHMESITCPECGHDVSGAVTVCPNCGHRLEAAVADVAPGMSGELARTRDEQRTWAMTLLIAAGAIIIGSFMAWATISVLGESVSNSGMDGDGAITLIIGVALALVAFWGLRTGVRRGIAIFALVAALLVVVVAVIDINDVQDFMPEISRSLVEPSVGPGLWLVLVAGIVASVASFGLSRRQ